MEPKTLTFDIEVTPITARTWGPMYETNLIKIIEQSKVLSYSAKWLKGKHITRGWPDYPGYRKGVKNDRAVVKDIWNLFNEANIIVVQNGRAFDIKTMNARFIYHNLPPPRAYSVIDTKTEAKKYIRLPSYSLDNMCDYFGIGKKEEHEGFPLWEKCMAGDKKAWKRMLKYNKHDVTITEQLYLKLRPYMTNHPNFNIYVGEKGLCPACGSKKLFKNGIDYTRTSAYQQFRCKDCNHQSRKPLKGDLVR